jgi:hypothetical protein
MNQITKYVISVLFALTYTSVVSANQEDIYTPDYTSSFSYRWDSAETGKQSLEELFPDDPGAKNKDGADVIKWSWSKKEQKWAGWGMQWHGWTKEIDFFSLVGQPAEYRKVSSASAKEFSKNASKYDLVFYVKGIISNPEHASLVEVKFDGEGDRPSKAVRFLSYLYDEKGKKSDLSKDEFKMARIPLNEFNIVRSRIDAGKIKQIVFGTPTAPNTSGTLYLYNIKIISR